MSIPQKFSLNYGDEKVHFFLPVDYQLKSLHPAAPSLHLAENDILNIRLDNPLATSKLEDLLRSDDNILIVLPDKTRNARLDLFFPHIFKILEKNNIPDQKVSILFASGSHPEMSEEEVHNILGNAPFYRFSFTCHNCRHSLCEKYGNTSRGTPVYLNQMLKTHSKIVVVNSVVHHYFAGFGGGPKMIMPGLAAYETIWHNHKLSVLAENSPLHPACEPGNIVDNPVYEDLIEAVKMTKVDFSVQMVLDENNQLIDAFCGDIHSSFQKATMRVHQLNSVEISSLADLVITSVGGLPKDINLIQSHKAILNSVRALKPNGILIIMAECREGWGNSSLPDWFELGSYSEMKEVIQHNFQLNGNTALSLKHKLENYQIFLMSKLSRTVTEQMGFQVCTDMNETIQMVKTLLPEKPLVYVIPNGSITLPVIK